MRKSATQFLSSVLSSSASSRISWEGPFAVGRAKIREVDTHDKPAITQILWSPKLTDLALLSPQIFRKTRPRWLSVLFNTRDSLFFKRLVFLDNWYWHLYLGPTKNWVKISRAWKAFLKSIWPLLFLFGFVFMWTCNLEETICLQPKDALFSYWASTVCKALGQSWVGNSHVNEKSHCSRSLPSCICHHAFVKNHRMYNRKIS